MLFGLDSGKHGKDEEGRVWDEEEEWREMNRRGN